MIIVQGHGTEYDFINKSKCNLRIGHSTGDMDSTYNRLSGACGYGNTDNN